jgi:Plasmid pRiA4b ORF-3-like protein
MAKSYKFKKHPDTFILEIQLRESKYPVWRIVELSSKISLHELHLHIQVAMGWTCSHMYSFTVGRKRFEFPFPQEPEFIGELPKFDNSTQVQLKDLGLIVGSRFNYLYDFGDSWQHDIVVKGVSLAQDSILKLPICSAGAMACPPEDIGGIEAYNALVYMRLSGLPVKRYDYLMEYFKDFDVFTVNSIRSFAYTAKVKALRKAYK